MVRLSIAALVVSSLVACEMGPTTPMGTITVKNDDGQSWKLLVTNDELCTLGLHTNLQGNTQTTYDVELGVKTYVCVDEKKPAIEVTDGGSYVLEGGRLDKR